MISSGFVNVIKPTGMSSSGVVCAVKKAINLSKVGHLGTLDPPASGVLPVAFGKATKFFDYFLTKDKVYVADVQFGILTDTLDSFGLITKREDVNVSKDDILRVLHEFEGNIMQIPPLYSAIKVGGRRACDIARTGNEVKLSPRKIKIFSIELLGEYAPNCFRFRVHCSAGTYIRTLFNDIAVRIGTVATTCVIIRERSGVFAIQDAITLDELIKNPKAISIEEVFKDFEFYEVKDENLCKKLLNGIKLKKQELDINNEGLFFLKTGESLIGMYHFESDKLICDVFLHEN